MATEPISYLASSAGLDRFATFFPLSFSLSFAAAFFASTGCFFIAILLF